ncbi:MAG TPA: hypothetical protein VJ140_05080 [Actinomycetota bacterium]|nr:hypothetical protein [Actinomycetota bacterium]
MAFSAWTISAWVREKGNVVDSFRDFGLFIFLLATGLAATVNGCAGVVREAPRVGLTEAAKNVKMPEFNVTPATPTTSTVPPAPPETPATPTPPAPTPGAEAVAQGGAR